MTFEALLVLFLGAFLAAANGANDVSKGVATLVGGGITDCRRAILWGTAWTAVGGLLGVFFASAMLTTFGSGLFAPATTPALPAALAMLSGAAGWVLFATRAGLPVSTTHAILGSLAGVAALAYGFEAVRWGALGVKILLPLLISPLAALLLTGALLRAGRARPGLASDRVDCLCAEFEPAFVAAGGSGWARRAAWVPGSLSLRVMAGSTDACAADRPAALRLTFDHLHWLTSGATSLARGMNDAPKIVALLAAAGALAGEAALPAASLFGLVTAGMVAGSLAAGLRVTRLVAERVTVMDPVQGFAANCVTSILVTAGAVYGLPMSTTHVSCGAIAGVGVGGGSLNRKTLRDIAFAWLVTLPAAAVLGMVTYGAAVALAG